MDVDNIYQFFIPSDIAKDDIEYTAAKNLVNSCVISVVVAIFFANFYYYINFSAAIVAILFCEIGLFFSLFILKYFHSVAAAGHAAVLIVTVLLTWLVYHLEGIKSPALAWMILPALLATFIIGIRAGVFWCFINIVLLMIFYAFNALDVVLPVMTVTHPFMLRLISLASLAIVVVALVYLYEADKLTRMRKLRELAFRDGLTQLSNRLAYDRILEDAIHNAKIHTTSFAVFLLDIDNFRRVNDTFGESVGNLLLIEIVHRIKNNILHTELMSRVGGDQFKIVVEQAKDLESTREIANILLSALKLPYYINKNQIHVTVSIGIVVYTPRKMQEEYIDRYVELALLNAKKIGGDNCQFYTSALASEEASRIEIERNLPSAITNSELELFFQPIYEAKDIAKMTSLEVLLRWHSKTLGDVPPRVFIPIAEKIGFITQLGGWVLSQACKTYMNWLRDGIIKNPIQLAINISPVQIYNKNFIDSVVQVLHETGMPAERLEFEFTETAIVASEYEFTEVLTKLRELGIGTMIDDFGTGNTTLSYLALLPVSGLKIDKLFLENMLKTTPSGVIIDSIINLAHKLNLNVIAEGVETSQQLDHLVNLNCDLVQDII